MNIFVNFTCQQLIDFEKLSSVLTSARSNHRRCSVTKGVQHFFYRTPLDNCFCGPDLC